MAEALGIVSSVIAVIDSSVKVASQCFEYYKNVWNAQVDIKRLQSETQELKAILEKVHSICNTGSSDGLEAKLEPRGKNKLMSRCGIRALRWPFKSNEVDSIIEKLGYCKDNIVSSLLVDQEFVISFVFQIAEADDDTYRVPILNIHQKIVLDKLQSVKNVAFESHDDEHNARCYQGTRAELLRRIYSWASNRKSNHIFWLNGMAGTSKSTISRTVARNFAVKGELDASFFFKRGEGDRSHAGMFFATIITQLVQKLPSLAQYIRNAIEANPGISRKALG
ncbi:hypothetical protein BOTNAR_0385g00030 [Botryotinia narcissicola]|uniref:Nephrocystin 3-like N-terminal domain-containing protein n=1 Tax=Botryotinia narcissicola TaxID=278944 RepID=A0A4Z1HTY5_9HELO|nr:hypothetical protein BOTNAR_0385g00030 [Botryotinia narcissicola]